MDAKVILIKSGKPIDLGKCIESREPIDVIDKNIDKFRSNVSLEFDVNMTEDSRIFIERMQQKAQEAMMEFVRRVDVAVENILRNYITESIKGEVTKEEVQRRGLKMVWNDYENGRAFVGIQEGDVIITPDGKKNQCMKPSRKPEHKPNYSKKQSVKPIKNQQ